MANVTIQSTGYQGRIQDLRKGGGGWVWGRNPQRGPGAEPLVGGQVRGGPSPPEAESSFGHFYTKEGPNVKHLNEMI